MEFGLREVLIGVGLLVIAAILFDGFRRMRRSKAGSLDLPAEMGASMDDDWEYYRGELPNGGARSVSLRKEPQIDDKDPIESDLRQEPSFDGEDFDDAKYTDQYVEESLYAETEDRYQAEEAPERAIHEPDAFAEPAAPQEEPTQINENPVQHYVNESLGTPERGSEGYREVQTDLFADDEMLARAKEEQERKLAQHYSGAAETPARKVEKKAQSAKQKTPKQAPAKEPVSAQAPAEEDMNISVDELADVIVINVMAKPGEELDGEDLYRAMTSCGFHHGDMEIFHRFEQHNGHGRLLFSVANVVEPGTFDPKKMSTFSTPGICMFLKLPGPKRPLQAFDVLLESARRISKLLGADMKDENHSVMTQQTFEHYRQRVVEFERKQLSQKALAR